MRADRLSPVLRPPPALLTAADRTLGEDARLLKAWSHLSDAEVLALRARRSARASAYPDLKRVWSPPEGWAVDRVLALRGVAL